MRSDLGVRARLDGEGQGVAGIAGHGWLAVAEDGGGHGVAWIGARIATRGLIALAGLAPDVCARVGAAAEPIDDRRWTSGPASRLEAAAREAGAHDEPEPILRALDGLLAGERTPFMVGCTAAHLDGARVRGAHVGMGVAWVVRAATRLAEPLVVPHDVPTVLARTGRAGAPLPPGATSIVANGLGALTSSGIGVDRFETTLAPGDWLVLASQALPLEPSSLAALVLSAADVEAALASLAVAPRRVVALARA